MLHVKKKYDNKKFKQIISTLYMKGNNRSIFNKRHYNQSPKLEAYFKKYPELRFTKNVYGTLLDYQLPKDKAKSIAKEFENISNSHVVTIKEIIDFYSGIVKEYKLDKGEYILVLKDDSNKTTKLPLEIT